MNIENEILKEVSDYGGDNLFVVDFSINASKKINLSVDSIEGITIGECAKITRVIRKAFEERLDEYELNVSSPGIGQAFKVDQQYLKNIGRDVELVLLNGEKRVGKLMKYQKDTIEIEVTKKIKIENKKKKETIIETVSFDKESVKTTKLVIKFK